MCLLLTAFNVFIGTAMLTELISFSFPAALLMWRRRDPKYLPRHSALNLGRFGWVANALVVGWTAFALVIWSFPVTRPVTAGSFSKLVETVSSTGEAELYLVRLYTCGTRSDTTSFSLELVLLCKGKVRGPESNFAGGRVRRGRSKHENPRIGEL